MSDVILYPAQARAIASAKLEIGHLARTPKGDAGLKLALVLANDELEFAEEYFTEKADADCDMDGTHPNAEMRRLGEIKRVRETLRRLVEALT